MYVIKSYNAFLFVIRLFILQVSSWINQKLQTATDESYREPTNLEGKIQKHQAFDAEITANKGRMDTVCKV